MTGDNMANNIKEEIGRGQESLRAAEVLIHHRLFNDAISRSCYAALHYARALLLRRGIEAKSHHGVAQLINLHFVKDGPMSKAVAADFSQLQSFRELSDYNAGAEFTEDQAREELIRAQAFIRACEALLNA